MRRGRHRSSPFHLAESQLLVTMSKRDEGSLAYCLSRSQKWVSAAPRVDISASKRLPLMWHVSTGAGGGAFGGAGFCTTGSGGKSGASTYVSAER